MWKRRKTKRILCDFVFWTESEAEEACRDCAHPKPAVISASERPKKEMESFPKDSGQASRNPVLIGRGIEIFRKKTRSKRHVGNFLYRLEVSRQLDES